MSHDETNGTDRRTFLQAGALATAAALGAAPGLEAQDAPAKARTVLPKRKLGKTGLEITMLEMGTGRLREQGVLDRLIRLSYASGVRTFDTAKAVRHRARLQEVVRAVARGPQGDRPGHQGQPPRPRRTCWRCSTSGWRRSSTDYIDLFFIHGLGDDHKPRRRHQLRQEPGVQGDGRGDPEVGQGEVPRLLDPPQGPRRRSSRRRPRAGIVDAIMLQYTPWLDKDAPLNKALDACHKQGDRPDLDEAGRRPVPRTAEDGHPRRRSSAGCRCSRRRS